MDYHNHQQADRGEPISSTDLLLFKLLASPEKAEIPDNINSLLNLQKSSISPLPPPHSMGGQYRSPGAGSPNSVFFGGSVGSPQNRSPTMFDSYVHNELQRLNPNEQEQPRHYEAADGGYYRGGGSGGSGGSPSGPYDQYGRHDDQYRQRDDQYGRRDDQYGRQDDQYRQRDDQYGRQDDQYDQYGQRAEDFYHPHQSPSYERPPLSPHERRDGYYYDGNYNPSVGTPNGNGNYTDDFLAPRRPDGPSYSEKDNEASTQLQKQMIIAALRKHEANGVPLKIAVSFDTPLHMLRTELDLIEETQNSIATVGYMRSGIKFAMEGLELGNRHFLGDRIPIAGWTHDTFQKTPHLYDHSLERVYNMYWRNSYQHPLTELALTIGLSAAGYSMSNLMNPASNYWQGRNSYQTQQNSFGNNRTVGPDVGGGGNHMPPRISSEMDPSSPFGLISGLMSGVSGMYQASQASQAKPQVPRYASNYNPPAAAAAPMAPMAPAAAQPPYQPPQAAHTHNRQEQAPQNTRPSFRPPFTSGAHGEPVSVIPTH